MLKIDNNIYLSLVHFEAGYRSLAFDILNKKLDDKDYEYIDLFKNNNILEYKYTSKNKIEDYEGFCNYRKKYTRKKTNAETYNNFIIAANEVNKNSMTFYQYYFYMDYKYREIYDYKKIYEESIKNYNNFDNNNIINIDCFSIK